MLVLGTGVGVTWGIWWGSGTRVGWLVEKTANRGLVGTGNGLAPVSWLSQSKGKAFERKRGGKKKRKKQKWETEPSRSRDLARNSRDLARKLMNCRSPRKMSPPGFDSCLGFLLSGCR